MELALTTAVPSASSSVVKAGVNKQTAKSVPAFLNKLYAMVNDRDTDHLIHWSDDGDSFIVTSADNFSKDVLPRYFKHSNFGSFVRQCNMYGFHKVPNLQQGVLQHDDSAELLEFSNPNFLRGQPDMLCLIKRQKGSQNASTTETSLDLPTLLTDLAAIRKHQTALSAELKDLQTTNHALWQEAIQSRERHSRQQETINKILRFLATVFGGHVVDNSSSSAARVRESQSGGRVQEVGRAGSETGRSAYSDSTSRVVMPRTRNRLLLEDVKGRQAAGSEGGENSTSLTELPDDEDDIEEIPLLRDDLSDLPTVSSSSRPSAVAARAAPRFSESDLTGSLPSPAPPSMVSLPSDVLSSFYANHYDPLASMSRSQRPPEVTSAPTNLSGVRSAGSGADPSRALVRSPPHQALQGIPSPGSLSSAPFDVLDLSSSFMQPGSDGGQLSPSYERALADSADKIKDVTSEKADIDRRTAALESAISRLMQNLPEHTRQALDDGANPYDSSAGMGSAEGDLQVNTGNSPVWADMGSGQASDEPIDIDRFLEQFVNSNSDVDPSQLGTTADYSHLFNLDDVATPSGSMRPPQVPAVPTNTANLVDAVSGSLIPNEVLSPSVSGGGTPSTTLSTPAATDAGDDEDYVEGSDKRRQTRKRKSDRATDGVDTKPKRAAAKRKR
ncbi:hypothetical protein ACM66B_002484 [Microbotryomycetes sp. NB124-2]